MSSFGFSIGDIVLVGNYAYSVYKSCKNAGDNFGEITSDDCKADLRSVKKILHDFRSLDTHDARYRDRLAFTTGKQAAMREKLATHSFRLQQLLSGINVGTLSRIERNTDAHYLSLLEIRARLDRIHMDVLAGRRDAATFMNAEDAVALEDEVLDDRMTEVDVDVSYEVHAWVERVRMENLQPPSTPGNAIESTEAGGTLRPSRNSRRVSGVQEPSDTHRSGDDSRIRRNSRISPGNGFEINEQGNRPEDRRESLEARRAPEGGVTPRQNHAPRALHEPQDPVSSKSTDSSKKAKYQRVLIDLRDRPCSHSENSSWPEAWYIFNEQEKRWVKQTRPYNKRRPKKSSSVLEYVDLTLEEVFTGTVKYFTVRRSTLSLTADNATSFEDIKINLNIGKGAINGNKLSYIVQTHSSEKRKTEVQFEIRRNRHADAS
ncbi:hypothetical protein J4E91_004945 [Alternaria rosae]|nr:hypothetical protein J4E91_004945 [Alternaria rosae]